MRLKSAILLTGLALVLLLAGACSDDPESPPEAPGLVGTWYWLETCYPYPGDCDTPDSEGYTRHLVFSTDSIYKEWRNDVLQNECGYGVIRGDIGDGVTQPLLVIDCSDDTLVLRFEDEETMTLSLGLPGSSVERFTRLPVFGAGTR